MQIADGAVQRARHQSSAKVATSGPGVRRWGEREQTIHRALLATQQRVNAALANNFAAHTAMRHLLELAGSLRQYAAAETGGRPELVCQVAQYLHSILEVFGFDTHHADLSISQFEWRSVAQQVHIPSALADVYAEEEHPAGENSASGSALEQELMGALTQVRAEVRDQAIVAMRSCGKLRKRWSKAQVSAEDRAALEKELENMQSAVQRLLAEADRVRDDVLAPLGVVVQDGKRQP